MDLVGRGAGVAACGRSPTTRRSSTCSRCATGRTLTAVQLQMEYLEQARKYVEDRFGDDVDAQTADVLDRWESVLDRLEQDPMLCAGELDWVAKLRLLEGYRVAGRARLGLARLQLVDLQYSDVRPEKGLYARLVARGAMQRLVSEDEVARGRRRAPPEDTRAYFRGECLAQYADPGGGRVLGLGDLRPAAGSRWSGCRRWSRCAAPGRTSGALLDRSPTAGRARGGALRRVIRVPSGRDRRRLRRNPGMRKVPMATRETGGGQSRASRRTGRGRRGRGERRAPTSRSGTRSSPRTSTRSSTRSTTCSRRTRRSSSAGTSRRAASDR